MHGRYQVAMTLEDWMHTFSAAETITRDYLAPSPIYVM